jgi:hypothetical protein
VTPTATGVPDAEQEYLHAAVGALGAGDAAAALETLGWWDLLAHLDDPDVRTAAFAYFRAEGRRLATSPALGGLLAQPYLPGTDLAPGTVVATISRTSPRRGAVHLLVGEPGGRRLLVDGPGHGPVIFAPDAVELRPVDLPGRLALHEVDVDWSRGAPILRDDEAVAARARSTRLGRVAVALGMLGAAEGAVDLAIDHARDREQFGQPIGRFQAVRHLLAWARTDCVAVDTVLRQAVTLDVAAPPHLDEIAKAIAGRNGRRACERALQVLGGIGFTAEHAHHHHHGRVLALDGLLGTSAELTAAIGSRFRTEAADPHIAATVLVPDMARG